ncbi:hypothetical protein C7974DRAFT_322069 [Boeremia exigua]|uniref:uncharacterized protein n=1 Tax=Boeremia exigua TaxID=749465 RepID=UPI001E8D7A1B|nr:uncharacterized protein C7974DRAFT_322069 [Boeremia exigua]KAH6613130.1 hypothetical protein C7974DRAFT_322069 [Boeremia exigua]
MDYYLNPQQVICSSLPELLIGDWGDETTKDHKLRWYYQGQLAEWTDFNLDVDHFFKALKEAFEDCRFVMSDNSPDILLFNPFFPSIEHTQVGAEIDLDGRFKSNVLEKVASVLKIIQYPEFLDKKTALNLPTLPKSMSYGSQKIFNFKDKKAQNSEPDIIFKIPGMGEVGQEVRLLCELKSCSTVSIHGMIEDVRKDPRPPVNRRRSTFRNLIGQAVRDMLAWGIRYGAVSTYNETIFLRLGESTTKPGEYRVYYTRKPLLSSDKVQFDTNGNISEDEEDKEEEEDEEDDEDNDSESSGEIVEGEKGDDTYIVL